MPLSLDAPAASLLLQLGDRSALDSALAGLHVAIGHRRYVARDVVMPGGALWAVRAGLRGHVVAPAEWALSPPWPEGRHPQHAQFVARAETLLDRPSFRPRALRYRALVPVTGFYLRTDAPAGRDGHNRDLFTAQDKRALLLGALYGYNVDGNLQIALVTTPAAAGAVTGSRRTPLVVPAAAASRWLQDTNRSGLNAMLASATLPALTLSQVHIDIE